MRQRNAVLLAGAAAAGAATIASAVTALLAADADARADARIDAAYRALAEVFAARPPTGDEPPAAGQRPALVLVKGGLDG